MVQMKFKYPFELLEKCWDRVAEIWDSIWHSNVKIENFHKDEEKFIISYIKKKNSKILELGCGTGRVLRTLYENDFTKLYGIDVSSRMIGKCRQILPNSVVLLQHDFRTRLPFESNFFDFILITGNTLTSSGVDYPDLVLKEVRRVLKNNGTLICGEYNAKFMEQFIEKYYKRFPKGFEFKRFDRKTKTVYIGDVFSHWVTERELKNLIENSGLKMISIHKNGIGLIAVAKE